MARPALAARPTFDAGPPGAKTVPQPRGRDTSAMSYAGERLIHDADSHLMELPDFLTAHADPADRDRMPPLGLLATGQFNPGDHVGKPGHDPETIERLRQLG